eukprot:TRINITY_DN33571_c0_g1_i1.p1 TRINITY_DN33571_c0_g1~~TRINITY_DN33571_c0_g1_i1.p1  ORF type:complete len:539 (+),score=178.24 TRINITY_DN33571_c0_g1_i1:52-1668(+)
MAIAGCDAVRVACDELRKAAELHDTAVAKAEATVRAHPDDDSAKVRAASAYEEKCRQMNDVLSTNIPLIENKLQEARDLIREDIEELDVIEKENAKLKSVKKALKEELEAEKARNEEAKVEEATIDNQLAEATKAAQTARKAASAYEEKGPFSYNPKQGQLYSKLLADKMRLLSIFEKYRVQFAHRNTSSKPLGHGFDLQRLEQEDFDKFKEEASTWNESEMEKIQGEVDALEDTKADLVKTGWPEEHADICDTSEKFNNIKKAAAAWDIVLAAEDKRRTDMQGTLSKFMKDDAKLLQWCRQERTNMEAQSEPHHVQEFCASLTQNIGTMEENFAHLGDTGEALLPNKMVERALVEVNEVWLNLQINAYERQRHIMLEIHQKSKLENEVRAFSNFSSKLKRFLEETIKVLNIPTDNESIQVVAPVLNKCRQLLKEFQPHALLADHLSDFSLRMEHIRDNYNVLRRTVFSKLTFLSTDRRTVDEVSSQRREEYLNKINEIKGWLRAHSEGENWGSIHDKVKRIQELVEKQLNVDEPEEF